jgi:hypothetical protein
MKNIVDMKKARKTSVIPEILAEPKLCLGSEVNYLESVHMDPGLWTPDQVRRDENGLI